MFFEHYRHVLDIAEHPVNRKRKFRAFMSYVSWNVGRRLLREAHYSIELVPGTRVVLSNRENYATLAYTCQLYDFEDMLFMMHMLRPGDCFGDFGANVGVYSVLAGACGASVVAVEPVPDTFRRLCANLRLNNVNAIPVNCGLSDRRQVLTFTSDRGGMNRVEGRAGANTCDVEAITVDELSRRTQSRPCLVKIDVEGYEQPLLAGASELLGDTVLAVIIELNGSGGRYGFSDETVRSTLLECGFSPYRYDPMNREIIATESGAVRRSLNTIFLKDSAVHVLRDLVREAAPVNLRAGEI